MQTVYYDIYCYYNNVGYPGGPSGGGGGSSPTAHGDPLDPISQAKVGQARTHAAEKVNDPNHPECTDLAQDPYWQQELYSFRSDIAETLSNTTYRAWDSHEACADGASAFTNPGNIIIYICTNNFNNLSLRMRSATLIHEALHSANLYEKPEHPQGVRTSSEITQRVLQKCPHL